MKHDFWELLQQLVDTSQIVIDRPKGTTHPRYPNSCYPVDYGFPGRYNFDRWGWG